MLDLTIVMILVSVVVFFILVILMVRLQERINAQTEVNLQQSRELQEIKEKILIGTKIQDYLKEGIEKTRDILEGLRREDEKRKEKEKEFYERIKRMDEILAGTSAKGISGEEILRETFKKLPPEMVETNFQVRGRVVEFALILPNGKRLPIDSKWPAGRLLLALEKETSPESKKEIIEEIEKEVIRRIKEIREYIDPDLTWSQAIAAIPDSVYSVCQKAHLKAREENVLLIPYSMVLPLLLYMYRLHLQYSVSIDLENLQNHLVSISKNLDQMEDILENKIARGTTMISNAYSEYKRNISQIRSSLMMLTLKAPEKKLLKENEGSS